MDKRGGYYFIEMNPRIQVEHTVTEMVTGVDLVRAQILIAEGYDVSHPEINLEDQDNLRVNGYAIQCRVTTEDPVNNFAPDTGKITVYRSGGGFGVRLDGGNVAAGAVISPYYDSLLVKVTTWDITFPSACRKANRALREMHVRGIKTNIPFVTNILTHPAFIAGRCHTKFIDSTPELFDIADSQDRATRVLRYIASIQVKNPGAELPPYVTPRYPAVERSEAPGLKARRDRLGPKGVCDWVKAQKQHLISHHHATPTRAVLNRMAQRHAQGAPAGRISFRLLLLEMWGGATFDVAYRFLHDPLGAVDALRESHILQMLLRANAVGRITTT